MRARSRRQILAASLVVFSGSYARAQARDVEAARVWRLGQPAPVGYHVTRKHTLGLVGGSLLAGGYTLSVVSGIALRTECYVPGAHGASSSRPCEAEPLYSAAPLLFIPVAGPFFALTNHEVQKDGGAMFWFAAFGTIQVAGAALLAYDLAVPHYGLKRGDGPTTANRPRPRFLVAPAYLGRGPGLVLIGQL